MYDTKLSIAIPTN